MNRESFYSYSTQIVCVIDWNNDKTLQGTMEKDNVLNNNYGKKILTITHIGTWSR